MSRDHDYGPGPRSPEPLQRFLVNSVSIATMGSRGDETDESRAGAPLLPCCSLVCHVGSKPPFQR